jgi:hypothetical protein
VAAQAAAWCEDARSRCVGAGKVPESVDPLRRIWGGDMRRIRVEALDRAARCLTAVGALDEAREMARELEELAEAALAAASGGAGEGGAGGRGGGGGGGGVFEGAQEKFRTPSHTQALACARVCEIFLASAEVKFHEGKHREAMDEYSKVVQAAERMPELQVPLVAQILYEALSY